MTKSKKKTTRTRQTKDKVLQARIPDTLNDELRDRARDLGLSVSTVVRNVLLNTFDLVEGVVTDSSQVARAWQGSEPKQPAGAADPATADAAPIGWQELTLNLNAVCEDCNTILVRGSRAGVGIPLQQPARFLCLDCLAALQAGTTATPPTQTHSQTEQ